jgi:hypothetical protein
MPSARTTVGASPLMLRPLVISPASLAIDTPAHSPWRIIQRAECTSCWRYACWEKWLMKVNGRSGRVRLEWIGRG